jgi:alanyl-tRNA synthetase
MKSIRQVEHLVNQQIRRNLPVITKVMNLDEAKQAGAMALFGEKYDDDVRVVSMGDFSTELCGGTHVNHTGDIGFFKITSEAGIAAGVRRIEAVTGQFAIDLIHRLAEETEKAANLVKGDQFNIGEKVMQLVDRNKMLEKDISQLKAKLASAASNNATDQIQTINGVKVLLAHLEGVEGKALRSSVDELKVKLDSGVILLAAVNDGKVSLVAGVTKDLTSRVKAGEMVNIAAQCVGGKGGGRPDMAQAGGNQADGLPKALENVKQWLSEQL